MAACVLCTWKRLCGLQSSAEFPVIAEDWMGTDTNVVVKGSAYDCQYKQAKEIKESMCYTSFNLSCMGGTSVVENTDSS